MLVALLIQAASFSGDAASAGNPGDATWTVYHGNSTETGTSTALKLVNLAQRNWVSPLLDGQLYGEPLAFSSDIYVASENDTVYALSSSTGTVVWSRHLARPVPSSDLPCGDISPDVGITGTPVIDAARNELFVVADELIDGHPHHRLVGLSTSTGALELTRDVDPPGADPAALLQRTGLNLDDGRVVFAMGGNYGDCAAYRGRVVSVAETG
jgi:polyvinyl alcohol dehydrogenase (cytochrome)